MDQQDNASNLVFLRQLAGRSDSYISRITHTMHLGLLPSCLGRISTAVAETIDAKLRKYDQQLDGIMLGYESVKLVGSTGHSVCNSAYIHINVQADFYVFRPQIDGILSGTVMKKSGSSVTCLTNQVFTVYVTVETPLRNLVRLHDELTFRVVKIDLCSQIPLVTGHLDQHCWEISPASSAAAADVTEGSSSDWQRHSADSGVSCTEDDSGTTSRPTSSLGRHWRYRTPSPVPRAADPPPQVDAPPTKEHSEKRRRKRKLADAAAAASEGREVGPAAAGGSQRQEFGPACVPEEQLLDGGSERRRNRKRARLEEAALDSVVIKEEPSTPRAKRIKTEPMEFYLPDAQLPSTAAEQLPSTAAKQLLNGSYLSGSHKKKKKHKRNLDL